MLHFDRPAFRSGVMVLKATVANTAEPPVSAEIGWILRPTQKDTDVDFATAGYNTATIETALLAKYPAFLTAVVP